MKPGNLARVVKSDDKRNIGKIVSLYAYHDKYMGHKDVWLFDCNDGYYLNGVLKFTSIGDISDNLERYALTQQSNTKTK